MGSHISREAFLLDWPLREPALVAHARLVPQVRIVPRVQLARRGSSTVLHYHKTPADSGLSEVGVNHGSACLSGSVRPPQGDPDEN